MLTALLTRADVSRHMQALHLLRELREALTKRVHAGSTEALRFDAPLPGGSTLVQQATLEGLPAYSVTVRGTLHGHTRSVLQLHDSATGKLLAVMDAEHLTHLRISVLSAVAADVLARADAKRVAVLGSGLAASGPLKALRLVRSLDRVTLYEPDVAANTELALRLQSALSTSVRSHDSAEEAVAEADVVLLTGAVTLPSDVVRPGTHVSVLNAERFTESPLPAALLQRARKVCDLPSPQVTWPGAFDAELGQTLTNQKPGRSSEDEVTVFVSTGPAYLDLLAAWHVYEGARHDEGLTRLDLEA